MLALHVVHSIILLLVLITVLKIHPFVSLLVASFWMGLFAGMPLIKIADAVQAGFGNTLGFIGIVLGLGTMLGKLLEESGGAERIARTLIDLMGKERVHWAMYFVAFIVGIPLFFQVGFVLLIPLVYTITKELEIPALKVGLPMLAGLSVVHGILPPHPAALASLGIFKADIGKTIIYGLVVGLPASALAGPIFAKMISKTKRFSEISVIEMSSKGGAKERTSMPSFLSSMFTIFLPVLLLLVATWADLYLGKDDPRYGFCKFIGNPITALLVSLIVSFFSFGLFRGFTLSKIQKYCDSSLLLIASILLILGSGGAFSKVLVESGIGDHITTFASSIHINPVLFGWLVATMIRVATGSATVAMITSSGIVAPLTISSGVSPELMVLATGGGSLMLSHVNDAGFWLIKEYFKMTLAETLSTWTVLETILGIAILAFTLLLQMVVT